MMHFIMCYKACILFLLGSECNSLVLAVASQFDVIHNYFV